MITRSNEVTPLVFGGALLGVVCFGLLIEISSRTNLIKWVYEHETLAAGVLGVLAAVVTALLILWQIRQQYKVVNDERERQLVAAKSAMPLVIAGLHDISIDSFVTSLDMCKGRNISPELPELDPTYVEALKVCIEHSDQALQKSLSKFIREMQVQRSRLSRAISEYKPWPVYKVIQNQSQQNAIADKATLTNGGYLYSSALVVMMVEELWGQVGPSDGHGEIGSRASRIENLFIFQGNEPPEDWPLFIGHFQRTADQFH
ncbi:hypothetical protein [Thalassospira povalilytica]|uniref:Uncharacterized protein n=1 Tax=Thalassospira povalilytica TaxID=732237 RepID=A0A8I1SJR1_9PROT|nr:hypothetical protein [Thalassospira povalilytica]MBN8196855.1 hypothetical protein [Thalassospira povalilytica]